MTATAYHRFAFARFGVGAKKAADAHPELGQALLRAHIPLRPEMYLASVRLTTAIAATISAMFVALLGAMWYLQPGLFPGRFLVLAVPFPAVIGGLYYAVALLGPQLKARTRARDIDARLPYALNFIATMASAGATPGRIFDSLARQSVYGEVAKEAEWIHRDLQVLGFDLLTALGNGIQRTPSERFQDLLQGAITSLTSGGDLQQYFLSKAEQFIAENRQEQKKFLESLGVLAESFVVVVVAAPLFLMVVLSVMTMFGGDPDLTLRMGYMLVFVLLPLAMAGFVVTIQTMTPEA